MAEVSATWANYTQAVVTGTGGHTVVVDATMHREVWNGMKPSEMLLAALLGCTGADFVGILVKQRQNYSSITATAVGEQDKEPPHAFRKIHMVYRVKGRDLKHAQIERALELAATRYCSVGATIRGVADITHEVIIEDEARSES